MTAPAHAQHSESMNMPLPPVHERALLAMLNNMEELTSLYKTELDAIELRDMQLFSELQPKKIRLVQDCESHMGEISRQGDILRKISPALRERIFNSEDNLRSLANKSQHGCKIRAESVRRVQERLLDAARSVMMRDQSLYNKHGTTNQPKNKPVATAWNEAI